MRTIEIRRRNAGHSSEYMTLKVLDAFGNVRKVHTGKYAYIYRVAQQYKKEGYKCR